MSEAAKPDLKRQNFNVTPEQEAQIEWLQRALDASSAKDAILRAVKITTMLVRETKRGGKLVIEEPSGDKTRVLIPDVEEALEEPEWKYLARRPGHRRKQLYFRGTKLPASNVWSTMLSEKMTVEEAADDWDLSVDQVREAVRYCEANKELIYSEWEAERQRGYESGLLKRPESHPSSDAA